MASCSFSSGVFDLSSGIRLMFGVCASAGPAASASAAQAPQITAPITLIELLLRISCRQAPGRSDLQDFGDCIQSSQNGPHLVQPDNANPRATRPAITTARRNMNEPRR